MSYLIDLAGAVVCTGLLAYIALMIGLATDAAGRIRQNAVTARQEVTR